MKLELDITAEDFSILCDALFDRSRRLAREASDLSAANHEGEAIILLNRTSTRLEVLRGAIINQWK